MRFVFCSILLIVAWVVGKKTRKDPQKGSPYECGFDPVGNARKSFSLRYFLLAVIFLIFDVEVVLLFPLVGVLESGVGVGLGSSVVFLVTLLVGLFYE